MPNLRDLSPTDFEKLCKDILEKKLKIELRRYKEGKDGGIDASCFTANNNKIILQVKRYTNSRFYELRRDLKKEVEKVEKLQPEKYYVYTSLELNPDEVKEIYNLFSKYMTDTTHINTALEIKDFLEKEENIDIVLKNHKIYAAELKILNLLHQQDISELTNNDFGINSEDIDSYKTDIPYEKKIIINDTKAEYTQNSYSSIFALIYNNLNQKQYEHYLISADAGMGKSYEMKKAVIDIYNKSREKNQDTSYLVKSYFYDLTDFHYSDNAPWKKVCPKNISEPFYIFLDGLEELSDDNRDTLKKMINEERRNRENTYFIISYRTSSFNARAIENIFPDNKVNCHLTIPINYTDEKSKLLMIPFFRKIIDTLKDKSISIKDNSSLLELMDKFYKIEFQSLLEDDADDEIYAKILVILGDFAYKNFINESNTWKYNTIYKFMQGIDEDKSFKNKLEIVIKKGHGIYYNSSKDKYSFSHRIYQEYLIAFYFFQLVLDEPQIPKEFLTGEKNQIIKNKYSNIFALWLQLLDNTSATKNNAIKLLKTKENIQILFLCDTRNLDEDTKYPIFEYVIDNLDELPFLQNYIKEIANLVKLSTKETKLKICNILLENIQTKFLNGTNDYVYFYIETLENIISKDDTIIASSILPTTKELIKLIIDTIEKFSDKKKKYNEFKRNLFSLNDIVKTYEPKFSAYREAVSNKDIDLSYKRDFEVYQITHDFCIDYSSNKDNDIDVIENYHDDLLEIIRYLATISDYVPVYANKDFAPEITPFDPPAIYFELFLDNFIEQDISYYNTKFTPAEIPKSLRIFILKAIESLIDQRWIQSSTIFQKMMSILARMSDTLSNTENKTLQTIIFSKSQDKINFEIIASICTMLKNIPDGYRKDWFNNFILRLETNTKMSSDHFWIHDVLLSIIQHKEDIGNDLDYYLEEIKNKYDSNKEHFKYIYQAVLAVSQKKDKNNDLFEKYRADYNRFWGTNDALMETRETLSNNLNEAVKNNIPNEIECLFDKETFKCDGLKIFDIMEHVEDKENIFNCRYLSIKNYISCHPIDTSNNEKINSIISKSPNQIIANCLNYGASKDGFKRWVDTSWNYERFSIMKNYILRWFIQTQKELGIINTRISYIGSDNKNNDLLYENELANRIGQIKKELLENSETIPLEIKLYFFTWFKAKGQFDIQLTEEDIDDIIKLKNNESNLNTSQENPFYNLEYLLNNDKSRILTACIRYINYLAKNRVEIITDTNDAPSLTDVDLPLSNVIKYLKLNYGLIAHEENGNSQYLNIKLVQIFLYGLEKNRTDLWQECLSYFENTHINEKKVFAKEIDTIMTKEFIDSLKESVHSYFYDRLLVGKLSENPKTSFPNICRMLEEKFNKLGDGDDLKYTIALIILDKNTKVLSWLIDYFVEQNGTIKNYFTKMSEFNITLKCSFNDDGIKNLLKLLAYAHEKTPVSHRRDTLSRIALSWLENSATKENFDEIRDAIEKLMVKDNALKYHINSNRWLTTLEEKVFSNNEA